MRGAGLEPAKAYATGFLQSGPDSSLPEVGFLSPALSQAPRVEGAFFDLSR